VSLMKYLNKQKNIQSINEVKEISNMLSGMRSDSNPDTSFPIEIDDNSGWSILESPERYHKIFKFEDQKEVLYFVNEIYKYQFEIMHHCKIIIDNLNVAIESYTHDINSITTQDDKIKNQADSIYEDLTYFKNEL